MATLIKRRDGRFEIRESVSTLRGPRSRTLAIFDELTDEVLAHASSRATRPLDPSQLERRARDLAVVHVRRPAVRPAHELVAALRHGHQLPASVSRVLGIDGGGPVPDSLPPMLDWLGASDEERGRAVRQLLLLAGRVRRQRLGRLCYPRIAP